MHVSLCVSTSYSVHLEVRGHLGGASAHSSLLSQFLTLKSSKPSHCNFAVNQLLELLVLIPNIALVRIICAQPCPLVEYPGRYMPKLLCWSSMRLSLTLVLSFTIECLWIYCVVRGMSVPWSTWGDQRTTCASLFSRTVPAEPSYQTNLTILPHTLCVSSSSSSLINPSSLFKSPNLNHLQ